VASLRVIAWLRHEYGSYQETLRGKYGETIRLPAPLSLDMETDGLPVYGASTRERSQGERRS
jgi:hypothetical protein